MVGHAVVRPAGEVKLSDLPDLVSSSLRNGVIMLNTQSFENNTQRKLRGLLNRCERSLQSTYSGELNANTNFVDIAEGGMRKCSIIYQQTISPEGNAALKYFSVKRFRFQVATLTTWMLIKHTLCSIENLGYNDTMRTLQLLKVQLEPKLLFCSSAVANQLLKGELIICEDSHCNVLFSTSFKDWVLLSITSVYLDCCFFGVDLHKQMHTFKHLMF